MGLAKVSFRFPAAIPSAEEICVEVAKATGLDVELRDGVLRTGDVDVELEHRADHVALLHPLSSRWKQRYFELAIIHTLVRMGGVCSHAPRKSDAWAELPWSDVPKFRLRLAALPVIAFCLSLRCLEILVMVIVVPIYVLKRLLRIG